MESVDLVAVCDTDPARLRAVGRGRRLAAYSDYRELLRQEPLDAAVIAVPTRLHEEVTQAVVGAGVKNVLVEKPIAPSLVEACRLAESVERAGARLMPGHIERFNPAIAAL